MTQHRHILKEIPGNYYLNALCQEYGNHLEQMYKDSKEAFAKALELYLIEIAKTDAIAIPKLMAACLKEANPNLLQADENVYSWAMGAIYLPPSEFSELLFALIDQIDNQCWSNDPSHQSREVLASLFSPD